MQGIAEYPFSGFARISITVDVVAIEPTCVGDQFSRLGCSRNIEIGLKNWDFAEIISGLDEGDRVVSSLDRVEIRAGARVKVEEAPVAP